MAQILQYIARMLPYILFTLPKVAVFRTWLFFSRRRKGLQTNFFHEAGYISFSLFLGGLISLTVLPLIQISRKGIKLLINSQSPRINLIPLNKILEVRQIVIADGYYNYFLIEVLGNIAMFAIIGFMLPLLWKRFESMKFTAITCFLISLSIEIVQLVLPRASDVDDLLLNTLGGIIGYCIYRLVREWAPGLASKFKDSVGA